jgi:hypothetical protein
MTDPDRLASVTFLPTGHYGRLSSTGFDAVPVRVFERGHDTFMLVLLLDADADATLAPARSETMRLEYISGKGLVRLEGHATFEDRDLARFVAASPAEVIQRRDFVRVDAAQPVRLSDPGGDTPMHTHAVDISGGGMLVSDEGKLREGQVLRFSLDLEPGRAPLEGTARVVRTESGGEKGLAFEAISTTDRQRLIHYIFDRQRLDRANTRDGSRANRRRR